MISPVPTAYNTASAKLNSGNLTFIDNTGKQLLSVNLLNVLGKGSYGTTYMTDTKVDGFSSVVKVIKRSDYYFTEDVITEVIAQILIAENTKGLVHKNIGLRGPFVPRVFLFAKDEDYYYILNEMMDHTFDTIISSSKNPNNIKLAIIQIATVLDYLFKTFRFNHRDFKADNIMFSNGNGVRLIDFGFCCMNYNGVIISPEYSYPKSALHTCSSRTRDMNAMFFHLLNYTKYSKMSCPIKRVMRALMYDKDGDPADWKNAYPKYNTRLELKNMLPEVVVAVFMKLRFLEDRECSDFEPVWASEIKEINGGIIAMITEKEIKNLNPDLLIEYIKKNKPYPFIKRLLGFTTDSKIKSACLNLLGMNNAESNVPLLNKTLLNKHFASLNKTRTKRALNKNNSNNYNKKTNRTLNNNNKKKYKSNEGVANEGAANEDKENLAADILLQAALIKDEVKLDEILQKTYNDKYINYKNKEGTTPLMAAAGALNILLVKKLMKFPFIVADAQNLNGDNALHFAMKAKAGNNNKEAFERKIIIMDTIMARQPQISEQKNKNGVSPKELLIKIKRDGGGVPNLRNLHRR